jgi:hypothetical protein
MRRSGDRFKATNLMPGLSGFGRFLPVVREE